MTTLEHGYSNQLFVNSVDDISFSHDSSLLIATSSEEKRIRVIKVDTRADIVDCILNAKIFATYFLFHCNFCLFVLDLITIPYELPLIAVNPHGCAITFDKNGKVSTYFHV
jgi:hypothetical protein